MKRRLHRGFIIILLALFLGLGPSGLLLAEEESFYEGSEIPRILPRSSWDSSNGLSRLLDWIPELGTSNASSTNGTNIAEISKLPLGDDGKVKLPDYFRVDRIVVHDIGCRVLLPDGSRNPNCNSDQQDALAVIQSVFRFHAVTRGWGDIGYHFLIDRKGNIYEGRFGGNGVRGAHLYKSRSCENYNPHTIGVSLLGNFEQEPPTEEMFKSLTRLVGWLAATNGLDITSLDQPSKLWKNPMADAGSKIIEKRCDLSRGEWSNYSAPSLVRHKDLEEGNSDPAMLDIGKLRKEAAVLARHFKNVLYRPPGGENTTWTIQDGFRRQLSRIGGIVVPVSRYQLEYFALAERRDFPDNTVVSPSNRNDIYVIKDGTRLPVPSQRILELNGYSTSDVQVVSQRDLAYYPVKEPLGFPEETLVRLKGTEEVFIAKDGKLRHVSSASLFKKSGFSWDKILEVNSAEFSVHKKGDPLLFEDGALIKSTDEPAIYLVKSGRRFYIPTQDVFSALNLQWSDVNILSPEELSIYREGGYVRLPDGFLVKGREDPEVYLIQGGQRRWISEAKIMFSLDKSWSDIILLPSLALKEYPRGDDIKNLSDVSEGKQEAKESLAVQDQNFRLESEPKIRIGLRELNPSQTILIEGSEGFMVDSNGQSTEYPKNSKAEYSISSIQNGITFSFKSTPGVFTVHSYEDRPNWKPELNDNIFRGTIEVRRTESGSFWLINEVPLEGYISGLAEMVNDDHPEYKKALIVAARTYALHYITQRSRYPEMPFHLKNTSNDQLYKGYGFEMRAVDITPYVSLTRAEVILFDEKPIIAAYSSDSCGVSKDARAVWKSDLWEDHPYLWGGIKDPPETNHHPSCPNFSAAHGVGLSSAGARKLAEDGWTYKQILEYYYPKTSIRRVYP